MFWKGRIPLAALILSLLLAIEISVTSATNDKASEVCYTTTHNSCYVMIDLVTSQ